MILLQQCTRDAGCRIRFSAVLPPRWCRLDVWLLTKWSTLRAGRGQCARDPPFWRVSTPGAQRRQQPPPLGQGNQKSRFQRGRTKTENPQTRPNCRRRRHSVGCSTICATSGTTSRDRLEGNEPGGKYRHLRGPVQGGLSAPPQPLLYASHCPPTALQPPARLLSPLSNRQ